MKKIVSLLLVLILASSIVVPSYAAGVKDPVYDGQSPYTYLPEGSTVMLWADFHSEDGGTLTYQWYKTKTDNIATIQAIPYATSKQYYPAAELGVTYYCCGCWNNKSGLQSSPVYTSLIRVEIYKQESLVTSMEVMERPNKDIYYVGETLDLKGLWVRIYYEDGYKDSYNGKDLTVSCDKFNKAGNYTVTLKFKSVYAAFKVTVKNKPTPKPTAKPTPKPTSTAAVATPTTEPEHEHVFGEWEETIPPTCTEDGEMVRRCECGEEEKEVVKATGHIWDEGTMTKIPTDDEEGEIVYICQVCGEIKTEAIPKTVDGEVVTPEPTDTIGVLTVVPLWLIIALGGCALLFTAAIVIGIIALVKTRTKKK